MGNTTENQAVFRYKKALGGKYIDDWLAHASIVRAVGLVQFIHQPYK